MCSKAKTPPDRTPEAFGEAFAGIMSGRIDLEAIARRGSISALRDYHIDAILPKIESVLRRASVQPRDGAGNSADAYRLARMGEQLAAAFLHEAHAA